MSSRTLGVFTSVLLACASTPEPGTGEPTAGAAPIETPTASASEPTTTATAAATTTTSSQPTAAAVATAEPTATAKAPAGPPKDANALVVEPVFTAKGGGKVAPATVEKLRAAFEARVASSSKLAVASSPGVSQARHVVATFLVEAPLKDAKGLTVKMGFTGVEAVGKCPIFDLDQRLTMSGDKHSDDDLLQLQVAAVVALLDKLEQTAPTLKPKANCTATK